MNRFLLGLMVAAVAAIGFGSVAASAAAAKLQTFGTGTVTVTGDSATIFNESGQYGGVYVNAKNQGNKPLSAVGYSFVSTGDVNGGAPRFSIPIDTDGISGTVEGYAFLDAAGCGGVTGGTSTTVSTGLLTCHVNWNSSVDYANWAEFTAANPTYRTAAGAVPFIIADVAGNYAVSSIDLR